MRRRGLEVDAQQLLPLAPDHAQLDRRRQRCVAMQRRTHACRRRSSRSSSVPRLVVADDADQRHLRAERRGVARDVRRAAGTLFVRARSSRPAPAPRARCARRRRTSSGRASTSPTTSTRARTDRIAEIAEAPQARLVAGVRTLHDGARRPIPKYSTPAARTSAGSNRLRPSKSSGCRSCAASSREVGTAEFLPLGDDDQRVGPGDGVERRFRVRQPGHARRRRASPRPSPPDRRRRPPRRARARPETIALRRRLAHVVGVGLERQSPHRERVLPARSSPSRAMILSIRRGFLRFVDRLDCRENRQRASVLLRR
mgnify:CR=1 FL=1